MRSQLAIIDHNTSTDRKQAKTKTGTERFNVCYTKNTKQWILKPIKEKKEKSIFYDIVQRCEEVVREKIDLPSIEIPSLPSNIAPITKPDIAELIKHRKSRFST